MLRCLLVILIISLSAGFVSAGMGDKYSFELKWRDEGSGYIEVLMAHDEPFAKEPNLVTHEVLRGVLDPFTGEEELHGVNFILDKNERKLYVDLNRDGDLTNDPNGILADKMERGDNYTFETFPVSYTTDKGVFRYRLRANYWDYRQLTVQVESDYKGEIELYGNKWYICINDGMRGKIEPDSRFSLGPTMIPALGSMPTGYETNDISYLNTPKSLFLDGHCYQVEFEFLKSENGHPALWCTLTEKEVPMGMLRIQANSVNRLVFGNSEMLVLPPLVEHATAIPAGDFFVEACDLKYDKNKPAASPQQMHKISVKVAREGESIFKIGTPLQNSVRIERSGSILTFHYELRGAGGESYDVQQITNYENTKKPSVAIYKGGMQVAGGDFEFG